VGTGCLLELNGTAKRLDASYTEQWLESGDRITLQIDQLGELSNTIVREPGTYSLLALKKANSV
jgi:fumarylacetoacetate (FAA) hydrolase